MKNRLTVLACAAVCANLVTIQAYSVHAQALAGAYSPAPTATTTHGVDQAQYRNGGRYRGGYCAQMALANEKAMALNEDGFRVVAVAYKEVSSAHDATCVADEPDLSLLGFIAFLDPPKEKADPAIAALKAVGVSVKILTGNNAVITAEICR